MAKIKKSKIQKITNRVQSIQELKIGSDIEGKSLLDIYESFGYIS